MDPTGAIQILSLLILLLLSGYFSSAETAYTAANELGLKEEAENGKKQAVIALKLLDNKSKLLSAILIFNNIVNLSASALTTTIAMKYLGSAYIALATGILTFILLIVGEITPKTIATVKSETIALKYASVLYLVVKLLTPVIFIVDKFSRAFLKLFNVDPDAAREAMTEYELRSIVAASHEDGVIETEERQMIDNVVDFGDSCAKDVMIPRVEMCSVSIESTFNELKEVFFDKKYTRIPVYDETPDNIVGVLNMKDLLFYQNYDGFNIRSIMREPNFTFEYKKTSDLLMEMRENTIPMIFVLDEYGATVGLVTLEDLLEEIVGEIRDEYDEDEDDLIKETGENEYLLDGTLKLDDINNALGTTLSSEEYDSIGGLIIEKLDHIPEVNESVELKEEHIRLTVNQMDKTHIESVIMQILPYSSAEASESEEVSSEAEPS
ncbi:MAG: hemolysin family protein [Lachnospiraceae bacterium]|nr:hemolysin family protein [Lachnospiraceae bacterium]MCI6409686.1 hemolysin family protein [Lachnospiraceae bacterium]MCI6665878.1 hemolysin family protein [Lachnospiraceae bacterium]MCI6977181.1 hemolysin family protein [Lachnospiraceae bacterium]MDD6580755.1 hemolysin family protein [Lachnospiraceae bacterium]